LVAATFGVLLHDYVYGHLYSCDYDDEVIAMWARDDVHAHSTPVRPVPWPERPDQLTDLIAGDPAIGVPAQERLWQKSALVTGFYDESTYTFMEQTHTVRFVVTDDEVAVDCWLVRSPNSVHPSSRIAAD
jgi:hypothetical protein